MPNSQNKLSKEEAVYSAYLTTKYKKLKIVIRSNPGLVLIKEGVVVGKWAWRDLPTFSEFVNLP